MYEYMKSGIYKITNLKTGKFYIGSSKQIERRWWEHKDNLKNNCHINPRLQHSWNFYGADQFEFNIIEDVIDETQLLIREQYYLDTFKPHIKGIGYNISDIAGGGDNFTNNPNKELIREKLREMFSGENNPMFGKEHSEATIDKQKEKAIGRFSLSWFITKYGEIKGREEYDNRSIKLKNRNINYKYDNKMTGIKRGPMSEENKKKISEAKLRLKIIKPQLIEDILRNELTTFELVEKYKIGRVTILDYKKKALLT